MKIFQRFLSLAIVVVLLNSAAYADSSTAVMFQLPEQFTYTNFTMSEKGYCIAGYDGISPVEIPVGMFYDPSGGQVWQHMNIDYPGNIYRSMVELDNGSLAAIRSVDYDGNFDIELFDGNRSVYKTIPMVNPFHITPVQGGFLVDSAPSAESSQISMFDYSGNVQWTIDWDEKMRFNRIISSNSEFYAVGTRTDHGCIVTFDSNGNLLWYHNSDIPSEYIDVVPYEENLFVLATSWEEDRNFVAAYNATEVLWESELPATIGNNDITTKIIQASAITLCNNRIVVASAAREQDVGKLAMHYFNLTGTNTHNETIDINGLYPKDVFMMSDGDKVHFAVLGRKTERNTDWQNVTGMPYFALIDTVEALPDA